jgi:hypothetical protein
MLTGNLECRGDRPEFVAQHPFERHVRRACDLKLEKEFRLTLIDGLERQR